jgi:lauroyl/myristoyl acyltransferase
LDLRVTVGLLAGFVATLPVPRRLDPWLAGRLVSLFMRLQPRKVESAEATIRRGLGPRADQFDMAEVTRRFYEGKVEYALGRARGLWPRRWEPQIEVDGREYVDQALAEGRGAILWRIDMTDTTVLQRGAWQSGWPLVQLSSIIHGVTNSQLGMRVTAPLYARPENAYLVERVRIPADWSFGYMPQLLRALKANRVVAILGEVVARQNVTVSILEGTRPIPTGAPAIAHRTGAALIPAVTFREGPLQYRLQLGPPIEVDQSLPRREATEQAVLEFGRRIEQAVAAHPSDWLGWWRLHLNENGPATTQAMA